ncbi:MAG: leucine-rich repeat domain-containing protein [Lachnospiraceae bacterium]|nr:leucine-rich repeat domain-containing protein [Lachnospiraceae bacterium]
MKLRKRVLSIILAAAMCIPASFLQYMPAYAAESSKKSGTCGKNLTWVLDDNGTNTISGTGSMRDNWRYGATPRERQEIKAIVIEDGVTSINDYAFMECTGAETVSIAKSVTSIGKYAFESCYKLTGVSIPEGITSIGDYAFNSCGCLTGISIPKGVTRIGECSFKGTAITDIVIPSSVLEIGDAALASENLKTIKVSAGNSNYCTLDGILYNKDFSTLIKAPVTIESCTIPESVSAINNNAFEKCRKLTDISIPENVTSIGDYVFMECTSLTEINVPESVKSIGDYAFYSCVKLNTISVPDGLTSIGNKILYNTPYYYNPDNWDNGALYLGNYLLNTKDITGYYKIREGTTIIAACAFLLNEGMTGVFIPGSVTIIGNSAFDNCKNLTDITISNGVSVIGKNAFFHCTNLKSVTIPDSVGKIGDRAFYNCENLAEITIPNSVKLGNSTFFTGKYNNAVLNITGGNYKSDMDLAILPHYFKEINYEREALDYKIKDNTDGKVHYAEIQETSADTIEHDTMYSNNWKTTFGITAYDVFGENDKFQESENPDGKLFAFYGDKDIVTVIPKDKNEKLVKIENKGFTFGAATIGDDGYYYIIWGKSISDDVIDSSMDEENIQICKYDSSGKLIKTLGLPVSYTKAQFPFSFSNTNISYNKGFLCIILSTKWTILPSDGKHHQGSEFIGINAETMEMVSFKDLEVSHEFGISLIPTDYGFAAIQRGDALDTRGISLGRYYLSDNTIDMLDFIQDYILLYHSSGQYGTNEHHLDGNITYVHMGGFAMSNSTYVIAGKSEHMYTSDIYKIGKNEESLSGIYDVFVRIADLSLINNNNPDFAGTTRIDEATGEDADYNMVWLTQCNEKEKAGNVKIVKLPDGSYCVLWEKM